MGLDIWLSGGITPAHAGNTGNLQPFQYFRMDHPRTRGEYFENSSTQSFQKGSPPHTRGILYVSVGGVVVAGITPAHAGNTSCMRGRERYRRDHPRTRGEYVLFICVEFNVQGSPPHTRGIPDQLFHRFRELGITPAHAGNTEAGMVSISQERDHPRTRGEYLSPNRYHFLLEGSPPHTRGIRDYSDF